VKFAKSFAIPLNCDNIILNMRTAKFITMIILMIVLLASVVLFFCAKYFSWKKEIYDYRKESKIKLVSLIIILASVLGLVVIRIV